MAQTPKLAPHPRLYITTAARANLRKKPATAFAKACGAKLDDDGRYILKHPELPPMHDGHNAHLLRARAMQTRVVNCLACFDSTGNPAFRARVIDSVRMMRDWEYWSWITWREGKSAPDAIYDLSYGENSATLAIAYDWLFDTLTADEKALFVETAQKWTFASARVHAKPGGMWWFGKVDSNWNTVCAGGLGLLCLAMMEDIPDAAALLARADASIRPFYEHLRTTGGAWPEGIGYWNYGMRYGFMYLLSHERATGRKHPVFAIPEVKRTLEFPIDFCPAGVPCSFGDVNQWTPLPIHLAAAERVGATAVAGAIRSSLETIYAKKAMESSSWPNCAEWRLFQGVSATRSARRKAEPVARLYKGLDWTLFADDAQAPTRAMTVRGGTTKVPHGHLDLLSFHCMVGGQSLITSLSPAEYLDTTFSGRRWDIPEMRPDSKNTMLVNGVGITPDSSCSQTQLVRCAAGTGVRLVATEAFGRTYDSPAAHFAGRLILFVRNRYWLVLDRLEAPHAARLESRMHTFGTVTEKKDAAILIREGQRLAASWASTRPSVVCTARTAPTTPSAPSATILRWMTSGIHEDVLHATVLSPGAEIRRVSIEEEKGGYRITVCGKDRTDRIRVNAHLRLR